MSAMFKSAGPPAKYWCWCPVGESGSTCTQVCQLVPQHGKKKTTTARCHQNEAGEQAQWRIPVRSGVFTCHKREKQDSSIACDQLLWDWGRIGWDNLARGHRLSWVSVQMYTTASNHTPTGESALFYVCMHHSLGRYVVEVIRFGPKVCPLIF